MNSNRLSYLLPSSLVGRRFGYARFVETNVARAKMILTVRTVGWGLFHGTERNEAKRNGTERNGTERNVGLFHRTDKLQSGCDVYTERLIN